MSRVIIIGTGIAGYTVVRELRKLDKETEIIMISRDSGISYSKPMLSNAFSKDKDAAALILGDVEKMQTTLNMRIMGNTTVEGIDRGNKTVQTGQGDIEYDSLVLASGANPIRIPLEGDAADQVYTVNNLDDYERFRARLVDSNRVCLLGGGLIGCEFANDIRAKNIEVDVVDLGAQPLGRLLSPEAARFFQAALEDTGVRFHFGTSIKTVNREGNGLSITLADDRNLKADLLLSAVGLRPDTSLAEQAGLETGRGILTDNNLKTSDPSIYALGDCAEVEGLVLPFIMPIRFAAQSIAASLAGNPTPVKYPAMPVLVKTPACPTIVLPPRPGIEGEWQETVTKTGVKGQFLDPDGQLQGFVLVGDTTGEQRELAATIPDWL